MSATSSPSHAFFEGSYLGDRARLAPTARLECKICWHVYDPAEGCETWQIPAGTPFTALPEHWRCPVCDGARDQFMVLDGGAPDLPSVSVPALAPAVDPHLEAQLKDMPGRFEAVFREIHSAKMKGVPFVNESLGVKAVGFRAHEGRALGVLVTPWFMNLVLLPGAQDDWSGLKTGDKELIAFPSGAYEFLAANRPETGPYKACSLFSPMFDFSSMLQAVETAAAVLPALFDVANREEGTRSGEIRRRAEEEAAALAQAEAAALASEEPAPRPAGPPPEMSRRAVILGPRAAQSAAPEGPQDSIA
ncbi:[NiFe]-hydrogenase assembly chaperone HybE [Xanthobacter oligotrophicus]|uniref:[NiFe]-hydrogenase assembly chaperone HybE n=1 Tax=Xanthobacter oligotrophicus TaxID=2607286 RepID=UPI0011F12C48|nr:[NiFe]-hydrogenase assembly chaperone HybE [Xanthobacter oligotrophicus]MCG5234793.1 [NiFe]-hydrogenase assembly chaperone HybE [Xanthobacter oligotrophicus]